MRDSEPRNFIFPHVEEEDEQARLLSRRLNKSLSRHNKLCFDHKLFRTLPDSGLFLIIKSVYKIFHISLCLSILDISPDV